MATSAMTRRATLATAALAPAAAAATASTASPPAPAGNAAAYRFRIGELRLTVLGDGQARFPAWPAYAPNATAEAVRAAQLRRFGHPELHALDFNVLLIETDGRRILVDSGAGAELGAGLGGLPGRLAAAGIAPGTIDAVILTHAHPDHIGGLADSNGAPAFPNAAVLIAEAEWRHWTAERLDFGRMAIPAEFRAVFERAARRHLGAVRRLVSPFRPGAELVPGITALAAPGHTPGHAVLRIASGSSVLLHTADLFHAQAFDLDHPGWSTAFDLDPDAAEASRRWLLDEAASAGTPLLGYHMPFPGLGRITRDADGRYAWAAAPWRFEPDSDAAIP